MFTTMSIQSKVNTISVWLYRSHNSLPNELALGDIEELVKEVNAELAEFNKANELEFITLPLIERFRLGGFMKSELVLKDDEALVKEKFAEYEFANFAELADDITSEMRSILTNELASKKSKCRDFSKIITELTGIEISMNNHDIHFLKYSLINTNRKGFKVKKDVCRALSRMMNIHLTKGTYSVK